MNEVEAVDIVYSCLVDIDSIPVRLSLSKGIDDQQVMRLFSAIEFLSNFYKNSNDVPKNLAFSFVDVSRSFERSLNLYEQDEQDRIIDLKDRVVDCALELLDTEE